MSRVSVSTVNGRTVAKGLYRLPHLELMGSCDGQTLVPQGSYITDDDLIRSGWSTQPKGGIYLCHRDIIVELPRDDRYQGCCGPDGDRKNVLDPDTFEPIAYEFADCWSCHYIRFAEGEFTLEQESPGEPHCVVGYVRYRGERLLVGVACGGTEKEAMNRLLPPCRHHLEQEAGYTSDHHSIVQLPIQTESATDFLARFHKEKPNWLFLKY